MSIHSIILSSNRYSVKNSDENKRKKDDKLTAMQHLYSVCSAQDDNSLQNL